MTLNDIVNKIAEELTKNYNREFGDKIDIQTRSYDPINNVVHINTDPTNRDFALRREGYEMASEVVRQTLYKIISEEIRSQKLDFIL